MAPPSKGPIKTPAVRPVDNVPNATALIASQAPQQRSGYALGTLSTGLTAGVLIGHLLGGAIVFDCKFL